MDSFGDHLVSCKYNQLTQRHHGVRDALATVLRSFGVPCNTEVALPSRPERPGDISLPTFDPRGPLMIDLCAVHPLAPSKDYSPALVVSALKEKESAKRAKYHDLCARDSYFFSPLAFHLWGGLGPTGSALLKRLIRQIVGDSQGWTKIHRTNLVRQRISVALLHAVAEQLLPGTTTTPSFTLPPGLLLHPPTPSPTGPLAMDLDDPRVPPSVPMAVPPALLPPALLTNHTPLAGVLRPGGPQPPSLSALSGLDSDAPLVLTFHPISSRTRSSH
jgi:hypothetical protein